MSEIFYFKKWIVVSLLFGAILFISRVNSPQNAKTGAPGEGTCGDAACHSGINFLDGTLTLEGLPDVIKADSSYTLKMVIRNPNGAGQKAGFQLTAINASNDSIGTFSNVGFGAALRTRLNRVYWEHLPSKNFDRNNEVEYTVDWTAPSEVGDGIVKIFASSVISDGNGTPTADLVLSYSDTITIEEGTAPLDGEIVNVTHVTCFGENDGRAILRTIGGNPPFDYRWSNGSTDSTAMNLGGGRYGVTVTDSDSTILIRSVRIFEPDSLDVEVQSLNVSCEGDNDGRAIITVSGGTRPYSYEWPDGENTNQRDSLSAGIYNVVIRDANACVKNVEILIREPILFINPDNFIVQEISCFGRADGAIDLRPGVSNTDLNYAWNTGLSGDYITDLAPGRYEVTISNINNCQEIHLFDLVEPELLDGGLFVQNVSAPGASDGTIRANINGGTRPYSYEWSNGGDDTFEIENLAIGDYQLTVTDARGCTLELSGMVDEPDCMIRILEDVFFTSCFGSCDGTICPRVINGTPPYRYQWTDGRTDSCLTMLCVGAYRVTVTDSRDCEVIVNFGVNEPVPLEVVSRVEDNICAGERNGSIEYTIFGGTPPYRTNPSNLSNLESGIYSVTILDANDCQITISDTIMSPRALEVELSSVTEPDSNQSNGAIDVNITGGTRPYFYFWIDQDGFSVGNSEDLSDIPSGCYTLTLLDANGCNFTSEEICIGKPVANQWFVLDHLSIYPNPITDQLYVKGLNTGQWTCKIFNSSGELMLQRQVEAQSSDDVINWRGLEVLPEGLHFVQLENGKTQTIFKVFKVE